MFRSARVILGGALGLAIVFFVPPPVQAAGYLKIGDIKGESTAEGHVGEIAIESWSWGESSASGAADAASQATARRQHKPLTITKPIDQSTPLLKEASSSGQVFYSVSLSLPAGEAGSETAVTYELKRVMITSYRALRSDAGSVPMESVTLGYEAISESSPAPRTAKLATDRR